MEDTGWKVAASCEQSTASGTAWVDPSNFASESNYATLSYSVPDLDIYYTNYSVADGEENECGFELVYDGETLATTVFSAVETFNSVQMDNWPTVYTRTLQSPENWKSVSLTPAIVNDTSFGCAFVLRCVVLADGYNLDNFFMKKITLTNFNMGVPIGKTVDYVEFKISGAVEKITATNTFIFHMGKIACKAYYHAAVNWLGINF